MELAFEKLESRLLLAASVKLAPNGTLTVTGDNEDNDIVIGGEAGIPDTITVGVDNNDDGDYDDEGEVLEEFDAADVTSIKINSKGGNDNVLVINLELSGNLSINTAAGDDTVGVVDVAVEGNASINTAAGNDTIIGEDVVVDGNTKINTAAGNDVVTVVGLSDFGGAFSLNTAAGDDAVQIVAPTFNGKISMNLGGGNDLLDLGDVDAIGGESPSVKLNGGGGTDVIVTLAGDFQETVEAEEDNTTKVAGFEDDVAEASLGAHAAAHAAMEATIAAEIVVLENLTIPVVVIV
jgi:hypothetical protein